MQKDDIAYAFVREPIKMLHVHEKMKIQYIICRIKSEMKDTYKINNSRWSKKMRDNEWDVLFKWMMKQYEYKM